MATFTATAGSSSTIGYAQYGSTSWNTGTTNGACQGAYQGTAASNSRVGVLVFSGAGAALQGKVIQSMTLKITCSAAGSGKTDKVLSFRKALYQSLKTGIKGSAQVGTALGTLTGKFYKPTLTPHYFRHNFATLLFEAGVEPLIAMKILGHTDYQTTANIYTHLNSEMMKKSSVDMEEVFRRKQEAKGALANAKSAKEKRSRKPAVDTSLPWAGRF